MKRFAAFLVSSLAFVVLLHGQQPQRTDADFVRRAYEIYTSMAQSSPSRTVPWQYLGPTNISGRATDVAVADSAGATHLRCVRDERHLAVRRRGATWRAIFEHQPSTSIGDIAVPKSNPAILYVGTGESNLFRASMPGVGMFKSTDGGRTFSHAGLTDTHTIARVMVHPTDPDIVYVAACGHGWTENEMRGVFKTTDGGKTWTKVLYKSPKTGAIDLVMDPSDPNTLYAATWQRTRRKWSDPRVEPGSSESGIWKTTDGGRSWTDANRGLPAGSARGRIGLDVAALEPESALRLRRQLRGRPAREGKRARRVRPPDQGSADQGRRDLPQRRQRRDVAQGQRDQRVHERTLGHLRLGVRPDSRRSHRREHDLHARPRPQRLARRRQDVYRAARHARRPPRRCGSIPRIRPRSTTPTTAASIFRTMRASPGTTRARPAACSSTT